MNHIKETLIGAAGIAGGILSTLYGGWSSSLATLIIFMSLDYISGLAVAGIFHKSKKTESGALESHAGFKGLCRKGMILLIVLVAARLDMTLNISFVRDGVIIGFIANETISLLENAALMGVKYPKVLNDALDLLNKKGDDDDEHKDE